MENKYSFQEIDNEIRDSFLRVSQVFDERNKLRDNWNSLREWLEEQQKEPNPTISLTFTRTLVKMNELEGKDNNENN